MSSKKRRKRRKAKNLSPLEPLFKGVKTILMHDLADSSIRRLYCMKQRGEDSPLLNSGCPPYTFKKIHQLVDFDKRVIWDTDVPFSKLSEDAFASFRDSQTTVNLPEPMSRRAQLVTQKAREIVADVLGDFSWDDWFDSCCFGKRAAVKLPAKEAYLDTRFNRISGSPSQLAAFNQCLARDVHLFRAVRKRSRTRTVCDIIKMTAVPKSWKAARVIAPDSILGGFLSRGLGTVIRKRLEKKTNIDLAKQQDRHRRWARSASITGRSSTIDVSKASDSFVWRHIELLVPDSWHAAMKCVRIGHCEVANDVVKLRSYMLMGSGHTFPLQTLLFFSLAEATRTLLKTRGRVSVYGDDIILPTSIAIPFIEVMSELGFSINSEKSFFDAKDLDRPSQTFFRESCGGDFKGGVDVRPYMPECDLQNDGQVPTNEFLGWCHKLINGLLDHWDVEEIPQTIGFLLREINSKKRKICFVPAWETSHAGITHYLPRHITFGLDLSLITYDRSIPIYWRLTFDRFKRPRKIEERPYVWYTYWLARNKTESDIYDAPIALSGEPDRRRKGFYRWKSTAPTPRVEKWLRKRKTRRQARLSSENTPASTGD